MKSDKKTRSSATATHAQTANSPSPSLCLSTPSTKTARREASGFQDDTFIQTCQMRVSVPLMSYVEPHDPPPPPPSTQCASSWSFNLCTDFGDMQYFHGRLNSSTLEQNVKFHMCSKQNVSLQRKLILLAFGPPLPESCFI